MSEPAKSDPGTTKSETDGEPPVGTFAAEMVRGSFRLLHEGLKTALSERAVIAVVVCAFFAYVAWVFAMPEADRAAHGPDQLINAIARLVANDVFAWGGWVFGAFCATVSYVVVRTLWNRNQVQGKALAQFRKGEHDGRVSSRDPDLQGAMSNLLSPPVAREGPPEQLKLGYTPGVQAESARATPTSAAKSGKKR